ncbi:dihydrolipoyl dehydrogenase [Spiribacter sp. 2438]|uniref:dihydrolipoyl dehydrogenase n=1 Tax=Spiribacter sp. 2438 TaxID=2666185 RepID=UPI0012B0454F|nr:dihydrolipoyl dehydrogenase [Spiribacter sp. 2438]QGM20848.1 dihydrolipoyl dehydrogenase [Spiribacter sp. 2438]
MSEAREIRVPDIGDFDAVEIIEVLVSPGDQVEAEASLITLESDKATMEVPAPFDGTIESLSVNVGDKVSEGDVIGMAVPADGSGGGDEAAADSGDAPAAEPAATESTSAPPAAPASPAPAASANAEAPTDADCDLLVVGAGPGGYSAAFRAADLGLRTILIERYPTLGGVCLNVGCIPSKALLHAAKVIDEAEYFADHGIRFGKPEIDLPKLESWKSDVVGKLTGGLVGLAKQRKVEVVHGPAQFVDDYHVRVDTEGGARDISFRNVIIAAGSRPIAPPGFDLDHPRIMDSTDALKLEEVPRRMLVVGGGIIGLEMASVYHALGSEITVVELADRLMTGADPDIVKPFRKIIEKRYANIFLNTRVSSLSADDDGVSVTFEGDKAPAEDRFDRVLVSVGRRPNTDLLNIEATGVNVLDNGCIEADEQMRTRVPHIFAIGDLIGQPMLAHKAVHEGKVAAEVAAGEKSAFDARVIPSVAYTDPEVAWVGVTQEQAKAEGLDVEVGNFPWAANGRSLSNGRDEGITKLIFEKGTERVIGAGIVGTNAGDLIAEVGLAIEMGADMHDIGLTIHPHPTLSETVGMAAEAAAGTLTDLYIPKKKR